MRTLRSTLPDSPNLLEQNLLKASFLANIFPYSPEKMLISKFFGSVVAKNFLTLTGLGTRLKVS